MLLQEIPKRKLPVRSIINKSTAIFPSSIYVYPDAKWMGTGGRNVVNRELFPEMENQLRYIKGNSMTCLDKDGYDKIVDEAISLSLSDSKYKWEVMGKLLSKALRESEESVVLHTENMEYTAIPYKWFKLFYDRFDDLVLCGKSGSFGVVCKSKDKILGIIMPYRLDVIESILVEIGIKEDITCSI